LGKYLGTNLILVHDGDDALGIEDMVSWATPKVTWTD